jgi:hypothetical protein
MLKICFILKGFVSAQWNETVQIGFIVGFGVLRVKRLALMAIQIGNIFFHKLLVG